ncbi:MAG TPA: hypothetical protein VK843_19565 [Planctomycetota bacterium]|nr:hypothetical protein [Planctomycetota bacterium]
MHGFHRNIGAWHGMVHGSATLVWDDQGGKRGDEELFSANMFMASASRKLGPGSLTLRSMLSLEPATVEDDGYPLLFQTGETEDGKTPLIDAQHPHDLFMEMATIYSLPLGADSSVFAYLGLPGEPALGPPTFMHRHSGMEIPEAPLSHHWLDSTHISYGVFTLGVASGPFKLDGSIFNGREPDEDRWNIETEEFDSVAARLSINPTEDWAFQVSVGDLHEPEQLEPDVDILRSTASAIYNRKWDESDWQTTLAVGRNDKDPGDSSEAFLLESTVTFAHVNTWFARVERVDKDELFTGAHPLAGEEFTIDKLSLGYEREILMLGNLTLAVGVLGSLYWFDSALEPFYGDDPRSFMVFLRGRL